MSFPAGPNPPANYGEVSPGIYRSSFPKTETFSYLRSLRLQSILTLVTEDLPLENMDFIRQNGLQHFQVPVPANKEESPSISPDKVVAALRMILDPRNHPILVHCNKGRHRTGCVIGCLRKLQGWPLGAILEEYHTYADPKARVLDEQFIEVFDIQAVLDLPQENSQSAVLSTSQEKAAIHIGALSLGLHAGNLVVSKVASGR